MISGSCLLLGGWDYLGSSDSVATLYRNSGTGLDVLAAQLLGMALAMKQNVAADPADVLLLGAVAVASKPDRIADFVEQARFMRHVAYPRRNV